uniref:Uncharacterized protein n=1 Tax=Proboscia inermis TaxID=420281 RepID=A0A7S0CI04_9STRA|mmetsp:Transcript_46452/g.46915  ORF Transcript_46452/g.46915 Transcript_46452/m.46915 type:complete len:228 (+) Transcript_46452:409-1092(+)
MAGAAGTSKTQKDITLIGVGIACCILAANLGSRAWKTLKLKTLKYDGLGAPILAYILAIVAGFSVPYVGYREIDIGGKVALENILRSAVLVALFFVMSDFDVFQEFILVGSEACNQNTVNICVGIWYTISLLASIYVHRYITPKVLRPINHDADPYLIESHQSPVGYLVPNLPNFPLDPDLNNKPKIFPSLCTESTIQIAGGILAFLIGGVIISLSFTDADNEIMGD